MAWETFEGIITGVSHKKTGTPCQDAIKILKQNDNMIVVVADGHGSKSCLYSNEGSQIAVDVVSKMFYQILSCNNDNEVYQFIRQNIEDKVFKAIENNWKKKVVEQHTENQRESIDNDKLYMLYGTTLLACIVTSTFVLTVQLGDGDILSVSETGETSWMIGTDKLGTETESLCLKESWKYMKYKLLPIVDDIKTPILFTISTDGYRDSFTEKAGFQEIGKDYLNFLKNNGVEFIRNHLNEWLYEASTNSGDDITLVGIFNENQLLENKLCDNL